MIGKGFLVCAAAVGAALAGSPAFAQPAAMSGQAIYAQACAACHQPTGAGIPGAFPAIKGDAIVLGPTETVTALVLNGRGGMPAFKSELDDASLAAVLTYARSAWGNAAPPVSSATVAAVRGGKAFVPPPIMQAH